MDRKRLRIQFILLSIDFIMLNAAFFAINYLKRETLYLTPIYAKLMISFNIIWALVSFFTKKYDCRFYAQYSSGLGIILRSNLYITYCISLFVVLTGMLEYSRIHIFGTCILLLFAETAIFSLFYLIVGKSGATVRLNADKAILDSSRISISLLFADLVTLTAIFFAFNYYKKGTLSLYQGNEILLLIMFGAWFVASIITRKFEKSRFQNFTYAMLACIKSFFLVIAFMSVLIFLFRLFNYSRLHIFGTFLLLLIIEPLYYRLYFIASRYGREGDDIESIEEVEKILKQENLPLDINIEEIRKRLVQPIRKILKEKYLTDYRSLFDFIDETINLDEIIKVETSVINQTDQFHLQTLDDNHKRLFINLHKINDMRWMNRYFLEVYSVLLNGGYFIGQAHTIATHKRWFFKKFPKYFAHVLYPFDFIINRALPKLPVIKKIYFGITKGQGRIISRAELLGRLCFCGFRIVAEREIDERLFFIAQKVKTPSFDKSPSYGPIVKFNRSGTQGRALKVYKFRTMHPYSEYLQEYIYEKNNLREGGKFKDDFRISSWGKVMRKTWLDELPMIYNWFGGDLQFFGVRPLSRQYLNLYPDDIKELRKKVKPGLIPPFYADMPRTFNEICESERCYIESFLKHPLRTQCVYFCRAMYNILIKGARSN